MLRSLIAFTLVFASLRCNHPRRATASTAATSPSNRAAPTLPTGERCEALTLPCGSGWSGCVLLRPADAERHFYDGLGVHVGRVFIERDHQGLEVCTGGPASVCRPPFIDTTGCGVHCASIPMPAQPATAPFTCTLVGSACVQGPDPSAVQPVHTGAALGTGESTVSVASAKTTGLRSDAMEPGRAVFLSTPAPTRL